VKLIVGSIKGVHRVDTKNNGKKRDDCEPGPYHFWRGVISFGPLHKLGLIQNQQTLVIGERFPGSSYPIA
jgi:hypothetical protein